MERWALALDQGGRQAPGAVVAGAVWVVGLFVVLSSPWGALLAVVPIGITVGTLSAAGRSTQPRLSFLRLTLTPWWAMLACGAVLVAGGALATGMRIADGSNVEYRVVAANAEHPAFWIMVTPTADTCDAVAQGDFAGVESQALRNLGKSCDAADLAATVIFCAGFFFVGCICWVLALRSRFAAGRAVATPWQSFGWTALVAVVGATLVTYAATSTFFRGVYAVGVVVATSLVYAWRLARPHIVGLGARPPCSAESS